VVVHAFPMYPVMQRVAAEIAGIGNEVITQPTYSEGNVYKWIKLPDLITGKESIEYARIRLLNPWQLVIDVSGDGTGNWKWRVSVRVDYSALGNTGILGNVDWNSIPEMVWQRDDTYAKLLLYDPAQDDNPPIYEPIEFFVKPTICDANRPKSDSNGDCYTWADYVAQWRVKMESILMEDLEGNGVEYEFAGAGGGGTKKASDFDKIQSSRFYDEVLGMDTAISPGDADDLEKACENDLEAWQFKLRARDNALAAGGGQSDNFTQYSDPISVVADHGCIVPYRRGACGKHNRTYRTTVFV